MRPIFNQSGRGMPTTGPATKWLCLSILTVSLVASVTGRKFGFGTEQLTYRIDAVLDMELWRLLTYPFVESTPFGLMFGLVILWMFGKWFEAQWGTRDFAWFFAWSTLGAGLLAIPISFVVDLVMPFQDVGVAEGPDAVLDALLVGMALMAPNSNVLLGFVLPIKVRTMVYILLGMQLITGIQTGAAGLSITLAGMLMGYLLVTGNWRPKRIFAFLHPTSSHKARRRALYVVPPKDDTLH